ncbi:MAG: hypothetical protein ACJ79H_02930 [Myxococcales bacterium]
MRLRRTALVLAASSFVACTGLDKFQAGRPIEAEPRALGHEYKQNGKPIETFSMIDGVSQLDEARADATSARNWLIAGSVLAAAGGAGLGYGVVSGATGNSTGWAIAGAGAGVAAISFLFVRPADTRLKNAVDAYNRRTAAQRPAQTLRIIPSAAPACDAHGNWGATAGLVAAF